MDVVSPTELPPPIRALRCRRCRHQWYPIADPPRRCPRCRSTLWGRDSEFLLPVSKNRGRPISQTSWATQHLEVGQTIECPYDVVNENSKFRNWWRTVTRVSRAYGFQVELSLLTSAKPAIARRIR